MRSLYILAGASCSGKTTLINRGCRDLLHYRNDKTLQAALRELKLHPTSRGVEKVIAEKYAMVNYFGLRKLAMLSKEQLDVIVLHLDLSKFFIFEFLANKHGDQSWDALVGRHCESAEQPGPTAIAAFWYQALHHKAQNSCIGLKNFERISVTTILCEHAEALCRRRKRDLYLQNKEVHHATKASALRLYGDSPLHQKNYSDHYVVCKLFLDANLEGRAERYIAIYDNKRAAYLSGLDHQGMSWCV
jgi:hypothetical protein